MFFSNERLHSVISFIFASLSFLSLEAMEINSPLIVHLCLAHYDMEEVSEVSFSEKICFSHVFIFEMVVGSVRRELSKHQIGCFAILSGNVNVIETRL